MTTVAGPLSPHPSSAQWDYLLQEALTGETLAIAYQPIVDLQRGGVVGYEALARFRGLEGVSPEAWFLAARARGVAARLDAVVVSAALAARDLLPSRCLLSINVEADSLGHPALEASLCGKGRLDGVVIEITEHVALAPGPGVETQLEIYRQLGAILAVDDAGSGYAGLQQILRLRPGVLKLDRSLVSGIDNDEVKHSLVEMLGLFADRIDAWVLAEGVERVEEASVLRALGVPLAQGFYFASPAPAWPLLTAEANHYFAGMTRVVHEEAPETLEVLLHNPPTVDLDELASAGLHFAEDETLAWVVVLDDHGRAVGLVDRDGAPRGILRVPLSVHVTSSVLEVVQRMLHRVDNERFSPIVCHDDRGRYLGTVRAERLVASLASVAGRALEVPVERRTG